MRECARNFRWSLLPHRIWWANQISHCPAASANHVSHLNFCCLQITFGVQKASILLQHGFARQEESPDCPTPHTFETRRHDFARYLTSLGFLFNAADHEQSISASYKVTFTINWAAQKKRNRQGNYDSMVLQISRVFLPWLAKRYRNSSDSWPTCKGDRPLSRLPRIKLWPRRLLCRHNCHSSDKKTWPHCLSARISRSKIRFGPLCLWKRIRNHPILITDMRAALGYHIRRWPTRNRGAKSHEANRKQDISSGLERERTQSQILLSVSTAHTCDLSRNVPLIRALASVLKGVNLMCTVTLDEHAEDIKAVLNETDGVLKLRIRMETRMVACP